MGAKLCYGRLIQFHGRGGQCNPRECTLASELGVSERTCRRFLAELRKHELIEAYRHGLGRSNSYSFLEHPWMSDFRVDRIDRTERPESSSPNRTNLSAPVRKESLEAESNEEKNPLNPLSGDCDCSLPHILLSQAQTIFAAHPKKIAKRAALRSIQRAIKRSGFEAVMSGTQLFAQTYTGELRFIPNPTTFFNGDRFLDEPETWSTAPPSHNRAQVTRKFGDANYQQDLDTF